LALHFSTIASTCSASDSLSFATMAASFRLGLPSVVSLVGFELCGKLGDGVRRAA
jgi:hypothetical protein